MKKARLPLPPFALSVQDDLWPFGQWSILTDTPEAAAERQASVRRLLANASRVAENYLGFEAAQAAWAAAAPRRGRGNPGGARNLANDALLLVRYDELLANTPPKQVRLLKGILAKELDRTHKGKFGNSPRAIAVHIRALVDARQKRRTTERRAAAFITKRYGPSFLG